MNARFYEKINTSVHAQKQKGKKEINCQNHSKKVYVLCKNSTKNPIDGIKRNIASPDSPEGKFHVQGVTIVTYSPAAAQDKKIYFTEIKRIFVEKIGESTAKKFEYLWQFCVKRLFPRCSCDTVNDMGGIDAGSGYCALTQGKLHRMFFSYFFGMVHIVRASETNAQGIAAGQRHGGGSQ